MKNNIRQLCLVLDRECRRVLPLITLESNILDRYIYENFEDSNAVRKHFQEKINEYLLKNKTYLETVYKNSGRKTEGSIVILETSDQGSITRKSVLYRNRIKEINNFLTLNSKKEAISKEKFIFYILKQNNSRLFLSNYEIDVLNKDYKYFSKTRKTEFLYLLVNKLKNVVFRNNDRVRDFYNLLKKYKPVKPEPILESNFRSVESEEDEIDPDKIHFDIPPFQPVYDDKIESYIEEERGHSLIYTYKPYHRR